MIVAAMQGRVTIQRMWDIATGQLPRPLMWDLGILRTERGQVRQLTPKQLYDMSESIGRNLSWTSAEALLLPEEERERRRLVLMQISDLLVKATHVVDRAGSSLAADESGVWSWTVGRGKPQDAPTVDPADEDGQLAETLRAGGAHGGPVAGSSTDDLVDEDLDESVAVQRHDDTTPEVAASAT